MSKYEENKAAKVGTEIICPTCGKHFVKKQYSQAFCCGQCKDKYWNTMGDRHKGPKEAVKKQQPDRPSDIEEAAQDYAFNNAEDGGEYTARYLGFIAGAKWDRDKMMNAPQAVGKVFTNSDPMNLYVESDKWNALLGQFENGQRVRIILVKEDAE